MEKKSFIGYIIRLKGEATWNLLPEHLTIFQVYGQIIWFWSETFTCVLHGCDTIYTQTFKMHMNPHFKAGCSSHTPLKCLSMWFFFSKDASLFILQLPVFSSSSQFCICHLLVFLSTWSEKSILLVFLCGSLSLFSASTAFFVLSSGDAEWGSNLAVRAKLPCLGASLGGRWYFDLAVAWRVPACPTLLVMPDEKTEDLSLPRSTEVQTYLTA